MKNFILNFLFTKTPLVFLNQSIWRDEAFTYFMTKKNLFEILKLTAADFNPPFYYLLIKTWIKFFGYSEISLRTFSLIFFWGVIYIAFLFFQNIFKVSIKKNLLFLIMFLTNPVLVYYAFEARMYTLFAFLAFLSYYFFIKKKQLPYIISSIIGLHTHYFMVLIVITQMIYCLITKTLKKQKKPFFLLFYLYLPWIIFVIFINKNWGDNFWITKPKEISFLNFLGAFYFGYEPNIFSNNQLLTRILKIIQNLSNFLFIFFAFFFISKKNQGLYKDKHLINFLLWGLISPLIIFLFSLIKPLFLSRYLIPFIIGLIILITYLLNKINNRLFLLFFVFIMVFLSIQYQKYQIKYRLKKNTRLVVKEIKSLATKDDLIYVEDILDYFPVAYYFGEEKTYILYSSENTYDKIPHYIGKVLIPPDKIRSTLTIYPKKTFILKTNGDYEIQAVY